MGKDMSVEMQAVILFWVSRGKAVLAQHQCLLVLQPWPAARGITASFHSPDLGNHLKTIVIFPMHIIFDETSGTSEACAGKHQHLFYFLISLWKEQFCCWFLSALRFGLCPSMGTER